MLFSKKNSTENTGSIEYIIVGLGNPGSQYENTRHNAGFITLDTIAKKNDIKVDRLKFKSLCGTGKIGGKRVLLMKPSTFMNLSGQAVTEAMAFYKIPPLYSMIFPLNRVNSVSAERAVTAVITALKISSTFQEATNFQELRLA